MQGDRLAAVAAVLCPTLPLHEATHYLAGRLLGAAEASVGLTSWQATWPADTPAWRVRVAHLAPSLLSLLVAPVVAAALPHLPLSAWPYTLLLYGVYAWPSETDRHPETTTS